MPMFHLDCFAQIPQRSRRCASAPVLFCRPGDDGRRRLRVCGCRGHAGAHVGVACRAPCSPAQPGSPGAPISSCCAFALPYCELSTFLQRASLVTLNIYYWNVKCKVWQHW